ncbi:acetylglutamate kinase [Oenococcus sp. UCMA 17063]|nr:acetylglutamate kinase [Oenococcus sp. UCMA 17063]
MTNDRFKLSVMHDLYLLQAIGLKIVLVHGGGPAINLAMEKLKRKTKFINGLRYTDTTDLRIINSVLSGEVNKNLVSNLIKVGAKAVGFSGVDGHLIEAKQLSPVLGYVGEVTKITPDLLNLTLKNGYIPVISSIGVDQQGQLYNINADTVAAEIAIKLRAQDFVLMTNVKGILKDADDPTSLYEKLTLAQVTKLINSNLISAGMIPKLKAITRAINSGLTQAVVLDGRAEHAILFGLLSDKSYGSLITH